MSDLKITFADQEPPDADYKKLYELQRYTSKKLIGVILMYIDTLKLAKGSEAMHESLDKTRADMAKLLLEI